MSIRDESVFITGFGAVTGCGDDAAFREAWLAGESSVAPFEGRKHEGLPPGFGAPAAFVHKDLRGLPGGKGLRPGTMTAHTFLAVGAVGRALKSAGLDSPEDDAPEVADRRGAFIGTYTNFPAMQKHLRLAHAMGDPGAAEVGEYSIDDSRIGGGMKGFTGFDFLKLMNNMPTAHVSIQANVRGPANCFLGHSSVGLQAIGRAWDAIRLDQADQFVAGASGPGTIEGLCLIHESRGVLADSAAEPSAASRPFDAAATGLVPADGGAAVVLETEAVAEARGARLIARLAGYAEAYALPPSDRGPLAGPSALVRMLDGLLAEAGWDAESVDYIAACAPGHPDFDAVEAEGLAAVFGKVALADKLAVHTGVTGFAEAAHGAIGLVGALQAMEDGKMPPMVNLTEAAGALAGMSLRHEVSDVNVDRAVIYSVASEGTMTALAIERVRS